MITLPYQGVINQAVDFYNREKVYRPRTVQTSLFFRDERFGIGSVSFDLLIDESHSLEFDISDHAVENGSTISDHVQERLRSVQVTGLFTNHPIGDKTSGYVTKENPDGTVEVNRRPDRVEVDGMEANFNVALEQQLKALKLLARDRKPVRLVTSLEVYEEMVIESLSFDRGPDDGESIKFTARLREVRTAKVKTTYRDGVWNPPEPKTQETEEGKKMAENEKDGKVTGMEKTTNDIYEGVTGEVIGDIEV